MNQRTKIIFYIVTVVIVIGSIFLIWAIDTNKFSSNADVIEPTVYSAKELQSLPAPDQSTFSEVFGKVVNWFTRN